MSDHLHHKLAGLHQALLHGKLPRDLHWTDALELIAHLGEVQTTVSGEFVFIVGSQREIFKRPQTSEFGMEQVSRLRRFLKSAAAQTAPPASVQARRTIVVIDHHAAHVFRESDVGAPDNEVSIEPYDPHHFHHHLVHRKEAHYQGDHVPEEASFYEEVAKALISENEIVLVGHGTGKSSAVDALVAYLQKHRPELFRRVVAIEAMDLSALTEPQVEAIAKRHIERQVQS